MANYPKPIQELVEAFSRLPGFGPKSAERLVFYLLKQPKEKLHELAKSIEQLPDEVLHCGICFNIATKTPCEFCADKKRDQTLVCVVAQPQDIYVIEKTGDYRGLFHVLGGVLSPVEGVTPAQLHVQPLLDRVTKQKPRVVEVILATNPDIEGEATALYLARELKKRGVRTTRIGKGLPMGSDIEYADEITVSNSLKGRKEL